MSSAGFLIYSGIMPLVQTFLAIITGYVLAKKGLFPLAASKGASQVTMNVALPGLIFANIVPAFTPDNASAIGPLLILAFTYMSLGFIAGLVLRELVYVPRNFRQGIVVMCGMSNWGNLPNAVVLTVTQQAPFNPATDTALGVSFVSIFIVAYHTVFWFFGAAASIAWDYLPGVPQGKDAEVHIPWPQRPVAIWIRRHVLRRSKIQQQTGLSYPPTVRVSEDADATAVPGTPCDEEKRISSGELAPAGGLLSNRGPDAEQLARRISRLSVVSVQTPAHQFDAPSLGYAGGLAAAPESKSTPDVGTAAPESVAQNPNPAKRGIAIPAPLRRLANPITISLAISLPIALINDLKALFVLLAPGQSPSWKGPDGNPPLHFVIDTASFLGTIAVPLALILLGASFARMHIPRPFSRLPIAAMVVAAIFKLFLLPVIGIMIVQAMVRRGLIPKEAKAERFVATFLSGTPAAVNQLIVTQLYSPDGDVDTLSAFLLVQYVLMFFSSSALTAVSLLLV